MNIQATTPSSTAIQGPQDPLPQALGALAFGIVIPSAVDFAPMDAVHNAARDVRHTLAFSFR